LVGYDLREDSGGQGAGRMAIGLVVMSGLWGGVGTSSSASRPRLYSS
jgi:hypothetical protein